MPVFLEHELDLLRELLEADVQFAVIGGAAVVLHGHKRDRKDLDLLLAPEPENIDRLEDVDVKWLQLKPRKIADLKQQGARISHPDMAVDILTVMKGVETKDAMRDRTFIDADGLKVPVISREHLISAKRAAGEALDLADIEALS